MSQDDEEASETNTCPHQRSIRTTHEKLGRQPRGLDFLAGGGAVRAKLLLSRIPAARTAPIPAAAQ
ncbi:MAG: hypothetical protein ACKOEO_04715, partial [Planctomycetaceae bacterium]